MSKPDILLRIVGIPPVAVPRTEIERAWFFYENTRKWLRIKCALVLAVVGACVFFGVPLVFYDVSLATALDFSNVAFLVVVMGSLICFTRVVVGQVARAENDYLRCIKRISIETRKLL